MNEPRTAPERPRLAGLTIAMIARDERENLEQSLPAWVEGADEVVVVDTGSRDGSVETARRLGARVVEDVWRDDFSRARNRGLDAVETTHVMWLDADDRISLDDLRRVRHTALERGQVGLMLHLVSESPDPAYACSCDQLRVFPARREHRFERRIHEQIQPSLNATGTPIAKLDVTIRHTGYASEDEVLQKSRRNLELSRQEHADGHRGIAALYHYVKAASICGQLDEAARIARDCVESPPDDAQPDILQNVLVTLGRLEWRRGRPDEAERIYREAIDRVPQDPFARYYLGDFLQRNGQREEAVEHLQVARESPVYGTRVPLPVPALQKAIRVQLGQELEAGGEYLPAANVYKEALQLDPNDASVRTSVARSLMAFAQSRLGTPA